MGGEHRCEWRDKAESLELRLAAADATIAKQAEQLAAIQGTVEKLQRHVFGQRSEKMPPVAQAIRDPAQAEAARVAALQKRRENAEKKRQLFTRRIEHKVREEQKCCPKCGGHDFSKLGGGDVTEMYELAPARVERQVHVQEKLRCRCGETIVTADPPTKVYDKARFGPTFMAQVVVSKCADSLPLYRQAKAYRRAGVQVDAAGRRDGVDDADGGHHDAHGHQGLHREGVRVFFQHRVRCPHPLQHLVEAFGLAP